MPILKLVIIPTKVLTNGRHKIRISVAHNSKTRYISTNCIIDNLSQFKDGQVVNKEDASYMNMRLRDLLNHYQKIIDTIFETAEIEKRVVYYSARKSFIQHGFELDISLKIIEYCIGQSMKSSLPIFNYFRVMRKHADTAIRKILDNLK